MYCEGIRGGLVDERFGRELRAALSPHGIQASLAAAERLGAADHDQRQALARKLEQGEYEVTRAGDQYNQVDPRNRLVTAELDRRWNAKFEECETLRAALAELDAATQVLGEHERAQILALGARFPDVWASPHCPVELKKRIVRAVVDEVIVTTEGTGPLRFVIHWQGGCHTEFTMVRPCSGREQTTPLEDVEVIRQLAERYGNDDIARVLNNLGRRTGKDKRWNPQRVCTARSTYATPGHYRTMPDPEVLTLERAAKHGRVSQGTIMRLVTKAASSPSTRSCRGRRGRSDGLTWSRPRCNRSSPGSGRQADRVSMGSPQ